MLEVKEEEEEEREAQAWFSAMESSASRVDLSPGPSECLPRTCWPPPPTWRSQGRCRGVEDGEWCMEAFPG